MVQIQVFNKKTGEKINYYMENRLKSNLDKKVIEGLKKKDKDYFIAIDGKEGAGKSTLAFQVAKYVDEDFNLNRIVFTPDEFREAIFRAEKGQAIVYDEAFTGYSSRTSLSRVNNLLVSLAMQMRQKNLCVIIVLPTFFLLDRYIALWRAKVLIHVFETRGNRGYFRVYNSRLKTLLYLYGYKTYSYNIRIGGKRIFTKFNGRFYGKFALGEEEEEKYKERKEKALKETEKNPMSSSQVKYRDQRDLIIFCFRKFSKLTYQQIANYFDEYDLGLSFQQIAKVCAKFGDIQKEGKEKKE